MVITHLTVKAKSSRDCQRCGLCCASPHDVDEFVDLEEAELAYLPAGFRRRHVVRTASKGVYAILSKRSRMVSGPLKGLHVVVCAAFRGALARKCRCGIYADRPRACQDFAPGSDVCSWIRRHFVEAVTSGELEDALR